MRKNIKSEEVNYKKNFCERYFDKGTWDLDVLNQVDVSLKDKKGKTILYIESKFLITNEADLRKARAQVILTNKKQKAILSHVALIYQDADMNDVLELIDCSDNSVMYNNDINWLSEKPSNPSRDAIDRINDRIQNKVTVYRNYEIKEFYKNLKIGSETTIEITEKNFNVVYNSWKNEVKFNEEIKDEQDVINLFLVDILNGTKYKKKIAKSDSLLHGMEQDLIREGTNLNRYHINYLDGRVDGIIYKGERQSLYYTIENAEKYAFFWKKYRRPPEEQEFLKILERSATLYSEKYRRDTGGEYTPTCFVEKQNELLRKFYNLEEFIVFDPCAGVGNLENQFGKDFKQSCYLSTLEQMDVDICKIKGFENVVQFDYLKDDTHPKWKYKGMLLDIQEICRRENKKLMVVMNPPYQNVKGKKNNLAIEFFNKVLFLKPQVIVFYYETKSFFRSEINNYIDSGYKIVSHVFSNAKTTFQLRSWPISQVIFDRNKGEPINAKQIDILRYEVNPKTGKLEYKQRCRYDNARPDLLKEIEKQLKKNATGLVLGQWTNQNYCLVIGNRFSHNKLITTENLKYALLLKGIHFNTHPHYFETSDLIYRGALNDIDLELEADAILFSLFYKGNNFSNKESKNYIMPFAAMELNCSKNDLNVLYQQDAVQSNLFTHEKSFDFRSFLSRFNFSQEARSLYAAALEIFRYYHSNPKYKSKDWNDSFYDITNAIMGKDPIVYTELETDSDTRITKVKTSKGATGFGKNTIKNTVPSHVLPIFEDFFDKRDILAKKINRQLIDAGLLLWERENIY